MTVGKKPPKPLTRKSPLRSRSSGMKRGGRLAKINAARQAKRRKRYAAKLAKSRTGQGYAEAMARAGGQCEYEQELPWVWGSMGREWVRCPITERLQAHHVTYARFGGNELADDYAILCERHHALIESQQYPHRQHRRSA